MPDSCSRSAGAGPSHSRSTSRPCWGKSTQWRGGASAQDDIAILAVEVSAVMDGVSAAAGGGQPGVENQTGGSL